MHIPDFTHSKLDDAPSSFLFPSPLIFAFTDELLSCVINLQALARWDSFILKKHQKDGVKPNIFQGANALDKYLVRVCLRHDPPDFSTTLQFSFLQQLRTQVNVCQLGNGSHWPKSWLLPETELAMQVPHGCPKLSRTKQSSTTCRYRAGQGGQHLLASHTDALVDFLH